MASINFHTEKKRFKLSEHTKIKRWIRHILTNYGKKRYLVNYIFCDDEQVLEINKKHLNHDFYTDIITFDLSEPESKFTEADIYISIDRVNDNADSNKTTFQQELLRVMSHGILHLAGYSDKDECSAQKMREEEDKCINLFLTVASNVPRGTGSRKAMSRKRNLGL